MSNSQMSNSEAGKLVDTIFIWPKWSLFIAGVVFLCMWIFLLVSYFGASERDPKAFQNVIPLVAFALLTLGCLLAPLFKGPRLEIFESEVHSVGYRGNRTSIRYDQIESMTTSITNVNMQGSHLKTKSKLTLSSDQVTLRFWDVNGGGDKQLRKLERFITELLVTKFWGKIESGESINFGKDCSMDSSGIRLKDGALIRYSEISEVRIKDGLARAFKEGEKKPLFKIRSKEENFFPCYHLLHLLTKAEMTYSERCSNVVKPIFG